MRALIHSTFGDPAEVLEVAERPLPEPGPKQVRVRTLLSPIHNHDLWTIRGTYGYKPELPAAAGTEAVGVIDALGEGVTGFEVGQRVVTGGTFGVWSEYFVAAASALVPVPDGIDDETAAQLVSMPFSALSLLASLDVQPGDWIAQNTANGAVGRLLAQFAAARGVRVLGLVRRDAGVDELAAAGIHDVVSTERADWRERAAAILGDAAPRAAVDSVGGAAAGELLSLLGEGGTLVSFGSMGSSTLELSAGDLIFKQAVVKGFWGSQVSKTMDAATRGALFGELVQRIGSGEVTLPVEAVFPFEEAGAAVEASDTAGRAGKVLLRF
ncbi:zinc-binding dehydrogenase [Microbacterium sp.]|uniref:zinc-binding dehydrogenase n=1 Tax=Microbacterium sp. TaxID=51671 RepID=UPI000927526D|nr:zinc-binding dehydrogenase [Microbacterium sp.]MBN9192199.1 zinc-binding dehydrogenase [Microbacterium sp.]OJU70745.1 MAG: NADPH:quinone oxidoreductase [Microbacterium sp. 70-38]